VPLGEQFVDAARAARKSTLARHVTPLWGAEGAALAAGVVQAFVVARTLGVREYGVVALVMSVPALLFTFFDPQAFECVVRYVTRFQTEGDGRRAAAVPRLAYAADGLLAILGLAVVAAAAPWASTHVVKHGGTATLLLAYGFGMSLSAPLATSRAVLMTFEQFGRVGTVSTAATIGRAVLVVGALQVRPTVGAVIYASVAGTVVEATVMSWLAARVLHDQTGYGWLSVRTSTLGDERRNILSFMAYTELTTLVTVLVKQADIVLLGAFKGPTQVAYYRLAGTCVTPVVSLVGPLQQVFYPRAATLVAKKDWGGLQATIRRQVRLVGLPLAALIVLAIPLVPFGIGLAGDQFHGAVRPAQLLLLGAAGSMAVFWVRPTYLAGGFLRPLLIISAVSSALTLAGYAVAAPIAGAVGVAAVRGLGIGLLGSSATAYDALRRVSRGGPPSEGAAPIPEDIAL
jgi:O-antigen/teichoic acid export membrane protein